MNVIRVNEVGSTNDYLAELVNRDNIEEFTVVVSDFQTAGKGQRGNKWESACGKNLTFSMVVFPYTVLAREQFIISMIASTVICDVLSEYINDVRIKWPNDVYWKDRKICGMLIENDLEGMNVMRSIIGIGVNINQCEFRSDAPNPVSLFQILGSEIDCNEVLCKIVDELKIRFTDISMGGSANDIHERYLSSLYRKDKVCKYTDCNGGFMGKIVNVEKDGHLCILDEDDRVRRYIFKEVKFII